MELGSHHFGLHLRRTHRLSFVLGLCWNSLRQVHKLRKRAVGSAAVCKINGDFKTQTLVGHNPLGAVAIVLLIMSGIAIVVTGYTVFNEIGGEWVAELHEMSASAMLILVGVHIAGVVVASWLHKENLARAMVNGFKQGKAADGISRVWVSVAVVLVAAVLGFWYLQWAPVG